MRQLIYKTDFSVPGADYVLNGILGTKGGIPKSFNFTTTMPKKLMIQKVTGTAYQQYAYPRVTKIIFRDIKTGNKIEIPGYYPHGIFSVNLPSEFITDGFYFEIQGSGDNGYSDFSLRFYGSEPTTATIEIDENRYGLSGSQLVQIPEITDERELFSKGFDPSSIDAKAVTQSISKISNKFKLNVIEK